MALIDGVCNDVFMEAYLVENEEYALLFPVRLAVNQVPRNANGSIGFSGRWLLM
jgi:hypothetical protein